MQFKMVEYAPLWNIKNSLARSNNKGSFETTSCLKDALPVDVSNAVMQLQEHNNNERSGDSRYRESTVFNDGNKD